MNELKKPTLLKPAHGETVSLLKDEFKTFLATPRNERLASFENPEKRRTLFEIGYRNNPVTLEWAIPELTEESHFTVELSPYEDFADTFTVTTRDTSISVNNLLINTDYFWRVKHRVNGNVSISDIASFRTEDHPPRMLQIKGLLNGRDIGGRLTIHGKRIKQGLIYRTAGLNDNADIGYYSYRELTEVNLNNPKYSNTVEQAKLLRDLIKDSEELLKTHHTHKLLECTIGKKWVLFKPDTSLFDSTPLHESLTFREIPDKLLNAEAFHIELDDQGAFNIPDHGRLKPAVLMQEFYAPDDGFMQAGVGGNWFWDFRINGKKVFDRMHGHHRRTISPNDYTAHFPVKKGKNLATALVRSGMGGWTWCFKTVPHLLPEKILTENLAYFTDGFDFMSPIIKSRAPGANRLDADGIRFLKNELGIKTDVDLRTDLECWGMTESPLGSDVEWFRSSSRVYAAMCTDDGKGAFAKVFRKLLDRNNYPLVFHCIAGADRTGAVAFILKGLLGAQEEELYTDWELTAFYQFDPTFSHADRFSHLISCFNQQPGNNIHEKIESYVLNLGFTQDDLASFRDFMLE
ncbi:MAG: tyrosine-protein phosphatase [Lentisphaerae bacterium]|nr:tyrosine-protein phosphatase [Lentisphaerota bacterium]